MINQQDDWLKAYGTLNRSIRRKLVFRLGVDSGFFSEYNNMIFAVLYCLKYKIRFILSTRQNTFSYNKGWQDFFLPVFPETHAKFHVYNNVRGHTPLGKKQNRKIIFYKILFRIRYFTQNLWHQFHSTDFERETFNIPELGIHGNLISASKTVIDHIWKLQPNISSVVNDKINILNMPTEYVGVHIRGGDKIKENDLFGVETYINLVKQISNCTTIFLATDDYSNVQNMRDNYPELEVYTTCTPIAQGYDQFSFVAKNTEQKKQEIIDLITDIEILSRAQLFIGTFSSNIGMFQVMKRGGDKCYSVEGKPWCIR